MSFSVFLVKFLLAVVFVLPSSSFAAGTCESIFSSRTSSKVIEVVSAELVDKVLIETIEGVGNFSSRYVVNQSEALELGQKWLGSEYTQIGKDKSGVFVSSDGRRRFRIDNGSLVGTHSPHKPHVHLELINPATGVVLSNNHIPLGN